MKKSSVHTIIWVSLFAIAMGFLESAVVVYMRELYYPDGFKFPLVPIDKHLVSTELFRELATMIMLLGIGILATKNRSGRFAYFIYAFAIWDIFYYVFLKALISWPESLMTWDILFMIPLTWVGPVITPVINSLCMILLAMIMLYFIDRNGKVKTGGLPWSLLIVGSIVVIVGYTRQYFLFMREKFTTAEIFSVSKIEDMLEWAYSFIPTYFDWWIYASGVGMHLIAMLLIVIKNRK